MKTKYIVILVLLLVGAGAWFVWGRTHLRNTTGSQTLEFYVNALPYTGGPSYQMFDKKKKEQVFIKGGQVSLSSESMKKIEEAYTNAEFSQKSPSMYKVKAKFELKKITDSNTSIPDAGTITYYMVEILEVYSATGV